MLLLGKIQVPPEPQSWFLMQPRNCLLEHLPAIRAAPKTVTQMARSARPSRLVSIRAQESPVLVPDQFTSSSCHLRDAVVEDEGQVGPGSHHSSTSFWPGWSSGPSVSVMQTARAGAAARRAHSRPATKSVQLVGLTVVEIIEASPSREARGAGSVPRGMSICRLASRVRNRCHCVNADALCAVLVAACSQCA